MEFVIISGLSGAGKSKAASFMEDMDFFCVDNLDVYKRQGFHRWDIVRIFAEPYAHNAASRRVLEKAGFHLEGVMARGVVKNGQLHDYCMYAKLK